MKCNDLIRAVKIHLKVDSDKDLAVALGVSQQTLANWRSRDSVPLGKLMISHPHIPWQSFAGSAESGDHHVSGRDHELEKAHLRGEISALERQLDKYMTRIEDVLRHCEERDEIRKKNVGLHSVVIPKPE